MEKQFDYPHTEELGYEAGPAQPRPWPGLVVLLALIIAGAVLFACAMWIAWL